MKTFALVAFVLVFSAVAFSQTIKTDDARRVSEIEREIAHARSVIVEQDDLLRADSQKWNNDHPVIKRHRSTLAGLQSELERLEEQKKILSARPQTSQLPNTDIGLLKVIALQNERIINLLEQLAAKSPRP